jgi:hypothetical protein
MRTISLKSSDLTLLFEIQENGWTSVFLEIDEQSIELGAETDYILFEKLGEFLRKKENTKESSGIIENMPVIHIFSLWEKHASVYGSLGQDNRILFFQNSDGKFFAKMNLTDEEIRIWLRQLH